MNLLRIIGLWGPVVAFMVLVYTLAGQQGPPLSGRWLDKLIHAAAYGIFSVFCLRAFHDGIGPLRVWPTLFAVLLALGYGALDEWHQAHVPGRFSSPYDWLADAAGTVLALAGVAVWTLRMRRPQDAG